jgi:hypothetical protein
MARKSATTKSSKFKRPELPTAVGKILAGGKVTADSAALLSDLIDVWGGTKRLALDIHAEFQKAAAGGMTRQRILEMLQRLVITNTTHEITKIRNPGDMDDEELERVAIEYLGRLNSGPAAPAPAIGLGPEDGEGEG